MRKLRDDITLKEAITWTEGLKDCVGSGGTLWALAQRLGTCRERNASKTPYPDSFYENPPPRTFGKFWDDNKGASLDEPDWGYYMEMRGSFFSDQNGNLYEHFEPCMPPNVDENGWPKAKDFKR